MIIYTARDVAALAGYYNPVTGDRYALKPSDVSTIASRYGHKGSPIESDFAPGAKKVRQYGPEALIYFAILNMLVYHDLGYAAAFEVLQGLKKRRILTKLKDPKAEFSVILRGSFSKDSIAGASFAVAETRQDLGRKIKEYLADDSISSLHIVRISEAIEATVGRIERRSK